MSTFRDLTNTRQQDILKALKCHYGQDVRGEIVAKVVCLHNGISDISDYNLCGVIWSDTKALLSDSQLFDNLLNEARRNEMWREVKSPIELILGELCSTLRMLHRDKFGGSLPENCPVVEKYLLSGEM